MKKLSIILSSALVVGLGVGLVVWHEKRAERAAIQRVLNERVKAREVFNSERLFYVVKSGDYLPKIAGQLGVTVKTLQSANNLTSIRIKVGQKLINPSAIATTVADYITELGKIDPSACPKQFRDAWLNYVKSWELKKDSIIQKEIQLDEKSTKRENHLGVSAAGVQIGSDLENPNLNRAAEKLEKLDNVEAWLECKRVAMDFGVFVP